MLDTGFISVIVPLKLEWEPVYAVPPGQEGDIDVGDRVRVVFAGREYVGVVSGVNVSPTTSLDKIKPVAGMLDIPKVSQNEIQLWRQVASYYMCTVGEVYKMAYPAQKMARRESERVEAAQVRQEKMVAARRQTLESRLARLDARIAGRRMKIDSAKKDSVKERLEAEIAELDAEREAIRGQIAALEQSLCVSPGEAVPDKVASSCDIVLSAAQTAAYDAVRSVFDERKPALLQGVTGSGKTELYLKFAEEVLQAGKYVLYLVPEIALSRQLEERLSTHFPDALCCYHSALSVPEKAAVLQRIAMDRPCIVLGTRSALFLPHRKLGLIVVDEEHDGSYKQDSPAPRYNGRDVALMLASICRCNIILGSATPSFESLYNCESGRFRKVELSERFHGDGYTEVELIDTNAERKKRGMVGSISRKLIALLKHTFEEGGQAMVLRARKSYATTLQCSECGAIIRCPHCNVSLSLQKSRGKLVCNHCGYTMPYSEHIPHQRPSSGLQTASAGAILKCDALNTSSAAPGLCNGKIVAFGAGTEKVEEELAAIFPERRIARLDADTSAKAGWQKSVLRDFTEKKIDLLVGTQMLTKGFDFDNLSLVAVLQADSLLGQQDFRADEKAVQLLEQFRGRCSRRGQNGVFVIQTSQPEHPVYQMILSEGTAPAADFCSETQNVSANLGTAGSAAYTAALMAERRTFLYPPYTRIVNVVMKDSNLERLERLSSLLSLQLRSSGIFPGQGVTVTPVFAPAVDRISDEYIRMVRIGFPKDRNLSANKDALARILKEFAVERKYESHISVDVDPA